VTDATTEHEAACDRELAGILLELLPAGRESDDRFAAELGVLEQTYGLAVYAELIYQLSHLRLPPDDAREHWRRIVAHRNSMQVRLGSFVDLRVALVSYFMNVRQLLRKPKIIEMQLYEETRTQAYEDALTGLRNYRFFTEFVRQEVARSEQYNSPLSLIMIDVDNFKAFNDRHGHEEGNLALAAIADVLRGAIRRVDVLARYGGEEFGLVLPSTPKVAAGQVGERARDAVACHAFTSGGPDGRGGLTISLGVATYPADASGAEELVRRADSAMYLAKASGKNRLQYFGKSLRSFRRVDVALEGSFRAAPDRDLPMTTVNVSAGGMLFRCDLEPPKDALVETRLRLPESDHDIAASGKVVQVNRGTDGRYDVAVRIMEMNADDRYRLARFLEG
jgi:diguanylate cyclase (GGDEF)-like protein